MRYLLLMLFLLHPLFGDTYEDKYKPFQENNKIIEVLDPFMFGEFSEIIRFEALLFLDGELDEDMAEENLENIIYTIYEYKKREIIVKIIGHTNEVTDNHNELVVDSDTYANAIQNVFRPSLSTQKSEELSQNYADSIRQRIQDEGIDDSLIVIEYRRGDDMAFTDELEVGKDLSNRVMVTLYVKKEIEIDKDGDSIFDKSDNCPDTPQGIKVNEKGCPLDSDEDGVYNYLDDCLETPKDVEVSEVGCPLDEDDDGVVDYKDSCLQTQMGLEVNTKGCPVGKTLALNFKVNSDEILQESYIKIIEFAIFMKENPIYDAQITGHTDSIGKANFNMRLSQRRAMATKIALMKEGVLGSRLSSKGKGELEPIQSNRTKEGRKRNRRIEIVLNIQSDNYE